MGKRAKQSRIHNQKALKIIRTIKEKFGNGISDIPSISEETRAWIQMKVQQFRECIKKVFFKDGLPSWWETIRLSRNKTAHQTEDFSDEEFSNLCTNLFSNIEKITSDLNDNINRYPQKNKKKRKFENFAPQAFGTESEKKQLVDAMEDMIAPVEPKEEKIEFPQNTYSRLAEKTLSEIIGNDDIRPHTQFYLKNHEGLSENIQTDILDWLVKTQDTLEKENPFFDEAMFIEQQKKLAAKELAADISGEKSKIQYHYKRLPSVSDSKRGTIAASGLDFDAWRKLFNEQKIKPSHSELVSESTEKDSDIRQNDEQVKWKSAEYLEALRRNFIADLEKNLVERKNKWEQERIDALRKKFLEEMYKKIQNFIRLEKLVSPFIKALGRLWDLSVKPFQTSGFEILETFAELLEKDESLRELAELLGKQSRAQSSFEKELRDKIVVKTEWHPQSAYRGEIEGLRYSADIASVLPAELAMMKNPAAKKLFQLKFAQKQLLSYEYQNRAASQREETEQEEISVEKKEPKGPIIVCVDTSGSMHGTPENIAKTVTFALSKIAIEEERKCYLISFSTGIETLDLSSFSEGNPIEKLVGFLKMSFNGGTDANPALSHAVKMLSQNDWKNADVLMVSDFVMGNFGNDLVKSIEAEKEKNTQFYSLVIGDSGNQSTIACFNHNWLYNTTDPQASRHLVERLHELKTREN